jgi:hypothetical protein
MVHVPSILEEADSATLEPDRQTQLSRKLALIPRCWSLQDKLLDWYTNLIETSNKPPHWYQHMPFANLPAMDVSPNSHIWFSSLLVGNAIVLYWTSLMLLYGTLFHLYHTLPPSLDTNLRPLNMRGDHAVKLYATKILQSIEYFLQPEMGGMGPNLTLLPLRVAMQYFVYYPGGEELQWCLATFERLTKRGLPFGAYLASLTPEKWPTAKGHVLLAKEAFSCEGDDSTLAGCGGRDSEMLQPGS